MSLKKDNQSWALAIIFTLTVNFFSINSQAIGEIRSEGPSVKSQVAKILLSGLGGAVLGISTLSFYDRPQDHLSNVAVGGVLGVVLGSLYVTKESLHAETGLPSFEDGGVLYLAGDPSKGEYQAQWSFSF